MPNRSTSIEIQINSRTHIVQANTYVGHNTHNCRRRHGLDARRRGIHHHDVDGHRTQGLRAYAEWRQREREALYKEFVTGASSLAVDALMHSMKCPDPIIKLYGVLSRIRRIRAGSGA